jgi:alkyl sulfatase BDS1-like metallo-beta-lactamase superfamily hydrolase
MVEGVDGIVIIDTNLTLEHAQDTLKEIRKITDKPVVAVVYTHHHGDHINGAQAFVSREQAASGEIKVIAAANFMREYQDEGIATAPIMGWRALYTFGVLLPEADKADYHVGCCGYMQAGTTGFVQPNTLVDGKLTLTLAGRRFQFFQTGGESASHMAVYLPDARTLVSGDELQGPTLPNLHSLRGTKFRDVPSWINAIDIMREYEPEHLLPLHGPPLHGREKIASTLELYRDAMQYQHDQSIRLINKGHTQRELAELIRLPAYMDNGPFSQELYGTVKHNVRSFYTGYISWWNGDAAELDPLPRDEHSRRMIAALGGRDRVFKLAEQAFTEGESQWSVELATHLIRIDHEDWPARKLKAAGLRKIGYSTANSNWRGFYLTAAEELEGKLDSDQLVKAVKEIFTSEETVAAMPVLQLFDALRYRLVVERVGERKITLVYKIVDENKAITLNLRNGILDIEAGVNASADAMVSMSRSELNHFFAALEADQSPLVVRGRIAGNSELVEEFWSYFEPQFQPLSLTVR